MAPVAAASRAPTLSQEALAKAIEEQTDDQLREMGRRLARSREGLVEMLAMEEAESAGLAEERLDLNETIDLMMKELHKLNIGAMNTVEPRLEEAPLAFVGRYWEKVKPRDTAYQTGEHVGEIKKPLAADGATPQTAEVAQEIAQRASQQVAQTAQRLHGALGPLWKRTQGFINEKQSEITEVVARAQAQRAEAMAKHKAEQKVAKRRTQARRQQGAEGSAGSAATVAAALAAQKLSPLEQHSENVAAPSAAPAPTEAKACAAPIPKCAEEPAPKEAEATEPPQAPAAAASPVPPAAPTAVEAAVVAPAEAEELASGSGAVASAEEQMQSTLLIEAHLKIDDGRVLVLQVKAADRCKEVAQRFVQDNSQKVWFQDPLTAWLKKVEADAVKFPVKVEGDLMEIRKQFSKNKPGAKA